MLTLAICALFKLVNREIGLAAAYLTCFLVSISPALFVASAEITYEVSLLSCLVIGVNFLSSASSSQNHERSLFLLGSLFLTFAVLIHPSALPPAVSFFVIFSWRQMQKRNGGKVALIVALTLLLSGPSLNILYNFNQVGSVGYTSSTTTNMVIAGWGGNDPGAQSRCTLNGNRWDSLNKSLCLVSLTARDPLYMGEVISRNSIRWISPYIGILKFNGSWYHGLDWRRLIPSYTWYKGIWKGVDLVLSYSWIVLHVTLFLRGLILLTHRVPKRKLIRAESAAVIFLAPIALAFALSIFTNGDPRHRLPVSPFYITFVAVALLDTWKKLKQRGFQFKSA